ncbi:lysosomal Pro-X carboxypeptidase-like [Senna tora]|uniref:Lysosomal Pro-X carboxypeptidase-like n=1 Tax=Senna tora TaxID=362788 RepID=A0A834TM06_9FABA|nr:lysosomal Pro-X carboxypeptidase-like [Senna tora]
MIPKLSPIGDKIFHHHPDQSLLSTNDDTQDYKTFYYRQTLDHFNYRPESYTRFSQRYLINFKYWGGANSSAPIFVYLGEEAPIDGDLEVIGFLTDNAPSFNALIVYIEHRFYGESVPLGSFDEALKNAETRGYFNSAQAIADYAAVIRHLKKTLNAQKSPVIVIGGSYGGMLASWFRLKYPHMAIGALASSAPILYFDRITPSNGYYSVVTKDFREASESCYETILKSWSEIDRVASEADGLSILSQRFNTCRPLNKSSELKDYLDSLYASAAQYNQPPRYPVSVICGGIDGASFGSDILTKIYSGLVALKGNATCKVNQPLNQTQTDKGWRWQTCSEMVIPIGRGNETMFPADPFHIKSFVKECKKIYGVSPRPHWVTTYYGGHDIKLVLQKFGSNIIFSNGLRDPYSSGGVLDNISDSIVAVRTVNGSHCLDILRSSASDPEWLIKQREEEIKIIKGWISQYYADLAALKVS